MAELLRPIRGGFLRPFGAGWFIREFLLGHGPESRPKIDPNRGAPQSDINYEYKEALAAATARERAEKRISDLVVAGKEVTPETEARIYEQEMKRISRKFTRMRYHSFLIYFGVLKRLGWVEATTETEAAAIQDNYPEAPDRTYYRLTKAGREAADQEWSNPLFALYPEIKRNHISRDTGWPHRKERKPGT